MLEQQRVTQAEYYIASDGTRCTSAEIRNQHDCELREATQQQRELRYVSNFRARVSPKYVRLFYKYWSQWSGYCNDSGRLRYRYNLDVAKDRIMHAVVRRAKRYGWYVWRKENVLYVETPHGQCSWHTEKAGRMPTGRFGKWFRSFPERADLEWSGLRNSEVVIRRVLGERNAEKPLPSLMKGEKYEVTLSPEHLSASTRRLVLIYAGRDGDTFCFEYEHIPPRCRKPHRTAIKISSAHMRYNARTAPRYLGEILLP